MAAPRLCADDGASDGGFLAFARVRNVAWGRDDLPLHPPGTAPMIRRTFRCNAGICLQ